MSAMEERTPTGDASCFEDDMAWRYGLESARLLEVLRNRIFTYSFASAGLQGGERKA